MIEQGFDWLIGGPTITASPPYNPTFQSGDVLYSGPNGNILGNINLEFGLNLPTPSGTHGAALLLGSGGGSGTPATIWIISDQAYDDDTPGNFLGITAGETQPAGVAAGGELFIIAGASFGGIGGLLQLQGGTSLNGNGGEAVLQGGNSTNGIPGDAFLIGGENGTQGANVHLVATVLNGIAGVIRHRFNSNITMDEYHDGSWYFYNGGGWGLAGQPLVSGGAGQPVAWQVGYTGPIPVGTATLHFASGILVSVT